MNFYYPLKNKYECLLKTEISEKAGECLGLYFDYSVELCLQQYESQYVVGFQGQKPNETDPLGYLDNYFKKYIT